MANAIQSDNLGFLVGERVDWSKAVDIWTDIRNEVHSLRAESKSSPQGRWDGVPYAELPLARRQTIQMAAGIPRAPRPAASIQRSAYVEHPRAAIPRRATNPNQARDANGRFIAAERPSRATRRRTVPQQAAPTPPAQEDSEDEDKKSSKRSKSEEDSIIKKSVAAAVGVVTSTPEIDPAVTVAKEVGAAVSPIGRGFAKLFGSEDSRDKKVWYRRLWRELVSTHQDNSEYQRASLRRLSSIEDSGRARTPSSGGGILSGIANLIPSLGGGIGGILKTLGGGALGLGKGLLKKIPVIGGLIAGASAALSIFGPDDPTKSAADNRKDRFTGGGSGIGMILGGAIGSLAGPVGTVVGGVIGEKVGNLIGEWLSTVDWGDVGKRMGATWDSAVSVFSDGWKSITSTFSSITDGVNKFVKEKFGVDIGAGVDKVKAAVAPMLGKASDAVSTAYSATVDYSKERAGVIAAPFKRLLGIDGKSRTLERADGTIEQRDGGTVSWRNNNPGNLKFEYAGSADKSVKTKRTKEQALMDAQKRYGMGVIDLDQFGNAIFDSEASGRAAQSQLLKNTHGDKTIEEMLPKYATDDYTGKANVKAYAKNIYQMADSKGMDLRGKKINDFSPEEFNVLLDGMKKVEGYKVGSVTAIPSTGATSTLRTSPVITASTVPAVASIPSASAVPSAPSASIPAPPVALPAAQPTVLTARQPVVPVVVNTSNSGDVSQDVSDRGIAHIATGGIGGVRR